MVTHGTVMIGNAGETWDTIRRTRQFIRKLAPDSVQFSVCTPFPGTRFFDECKEKGWLDYEKWEDFDGVTGGAISYPGLSKHDIQRAVKDSYLDYYSSLPHVRQRFRRILYGPAPPHGALPAVRAWKRARTMRTPSMTGSTRSCATCATAMPLASTRVIQPRSSSTGG